jgi:hypothetical protein
MRWQFGGNLNRHSSREIYGWHILSTWHLSGSHGAHNPEPSTGTGKFMVRWPRTPTALSRSAHMRSRWQDYFKWNISLINLLLLINIFHLQSFFPYRLRLLDVSRVQWSYLYRRTCGVKTAKRGCSNTWTTVLSILWYVRSIKLFCKLLFSWIEYDDFFKKKSGDL